VARNRKKAKERRARRPEPVGSARRDRDDGAPAPIAHAAPDVELAEAQLAVGRPEADLEADASAPLEDEDGAQNGDLVDAEALEAAAGRGGGGGGSRALTPAGRAGEPAAHGAAAVGEHHANLASRLIAFLQGCWAELQRVQWPDRRQVMQATGVVIGFVIVAGLFLGASDWVSQQIVKLILK
jgi:preprotein translocase subunit SecE